MERTSCPHGVHLVAAYIQCKVIIADVVKNDGDVLSRPVQHPSSRQQQLSKS